MINTILRFSVVIFSLLIFGTVSANAQSKRPPENYQIKAAVTPAPDDLKEDAAVKGYNKKGNLVTLREGSNQLICLADNPDQSNFHVACYHKDLEPFMQRGRELKSRGMSTVKVDSLRRQEIKSGDIELPRKPMALYSITGASNSFNYNSGQVKNASPTYVIYIPFATEASTGLSTQPVSKGAPWIMDPGTPWAHIMVMTGRKIGSMPAKEE